MYEYKSRQLRSPITLKFVYRLAQFKLALLLAFPFPFGPLLAE